MKNFVKKSNVLNYKNTTGAAILSGALVIVGSLVGIAATNIAIGEVGAVNLTGVFTLPKATGAIAQGAKLYWVVADSNIVTTASTNVYLGYADVAALSGDATVNVILANGV